MTHGNASGKHLKSAQTATKRSRKVGTPSKLCKEVQDKIVSALRIGNYIEPSALAAGISKVTLYDWLKKGGAGQKPYAQFANAVARAMAEAETNLVAIIERRAREGDSHAALSLLARRYPERWGDVKKQIELSGEVKSTGTSAIVNLIIGDPESVELVQRLSERTNDKLLAGDTGGDC